MMVNSNRMQRILGLLFIVPLLIGVLAACSTGSGDDDDSGDNSATAGGQAIVGEGRGDGGGAVESNEMEPVADSDAAAPNAGNTSYVANQIPLNRLVIRNAEITLAVDNVNQALTWVRNLAGTKGGFVFSSNSYIQDEQEFAQITIRVPADQFDSAIQELTTHDLVVQVDSEQSSSQDVSQEFVDNESRLNALEETERRYLALLSEADDVDEILRIENELTNVRSQIETIKGRQNYLEQMTSYSTATVTLHLPDTDLPDDDSRDDTFIARVFGDSWDNASGFIEGLMAVVVTLGIVGLAVVPMLLLGYAGYRFVRRRFDEPANPAANTGSTS